jgi:hypothetical protein
VLPADVARVVHGQARDAAGMLADPPLLAQDRRGGKHLWAGTLHPSPPFISGDSPPGRGGFEMSECLGMYLDIQLATRAPGVSLIVLGAWVGAISTSLEAGAMRAAVVR